MVEQYGPSHLAVYWNNKDKKKERKAAKKEALREAEREDGKDGSGRTAATNHPPTAHSAAH